MPINANTITNAGTEPEENIKKLTSGMPMTEKNITSLHIVLNTHHKIHLPSTVCNGRATAYCFFLEKRYDAVQDLSETRL